MPKKDNKKINLIYLLGAGRSGTTLLATVLGNNPNIQTLGELHQFIEHVQENKPCSCGKPLTECKVWKPIATDFLNEPFNLENIRQQTAQQEAHKNIPFLLLKNARNKNYLSVQETIFQTVQKHTKEFWYVDSSKYIARYLRLKQSKQINLKGVYIVRDVRGVIHSFKKQVQTPKKPLAAVLYYLLINFFGEIVSRLDKNVVKIRYEDFIHHPEKCLKKIYVHSFEMAQKEVSLPEEFEMPHIVGGNRMKSKQKIRLQNEEKWKSAYSRIKQVVYYSLSFPIMLVNNYKI